MKKSNAPAKIIRNACAFAVDGKDWEACTNKNVSLSQLGNFSFPYREERFLLWPLKKPPVAGRRRAFLQGGGGGLCDETKRIQAGGKGKANLMPMCTVRVCTAKTMYCVCVCVLRCVDAREAADHPACLGTCVLCCSVVCAYRFML